MSWQDLMLLGLGFLSGSILPRLAFPQSKVISQSPPSNAPQQPPDSPSAGEPPVAATVSLTAYQQLFALASFKSSFLARTAHELRSPMNSLVGLHQLILEDLCEDPAEEREFVGQAKDAALKILRLLDTLIAASKLDSGREPPRFDNVSVISLFEAIQEMTQMQAANHNLRLNITLPEDDLAVVSDSKWLQTLLISLVEDAISHTHTGTVQVWAEPDADPSRLALCLQTDRPLKDLQIHLEQPSYQEAVDITKLETIRLSTSLTLAVAQTMLPLLKGQLRCEPGPEGEEQALIRCILPTE